MFLFKSCFEKLISAGPTDDGARGVARCSTMGGAVSSNSKGLGGLRGERASYEPLLARGGIVPGPPPSPLSNELGDKLRSNKIKFCRFKQDTWRTLRLAEISKVFAGKPSLLSFALLD